MGAGVFVLSFAVGLRCRYCTELLLDTNTIYWIYIYVYINIDRILKLSTSSHAIRIFLQYAWCCAAVSCVSYASPAQQINVYEGCSVVGGKNAKLKVCGHQKNVVSIGPAIVYSRL